jgi:acyl-CoA dehydrogenase
MNFDLSDEQKLFQEQVRKALAEICPLKEVRRILESDSAYSTRTWEMLKTLGVTSAAISTQYGGLGLSYYELCVAADEVGRALAPTPLSSSIYLAAEAILQAGTESQKLTWLPSIASCEVIASYGDTSNSTHVSAGKINGVARIVADAWDAKIAIVLSQDDHPGDGQSLFIVELDTGKVVRRAMDTVDPTRNICELRFDAAPAERLGPAGQGESLAGRVRERAAILFAFEQIGGADRALEMARDYALERRAFGRQIGSYQAIKHKLANVYIQNQIARAHALYGAWALSTNSADLPLAAAAARLSATSAFNFAAQENIQTHGGMGYTWEADCQLFYRRARSLALQIGSMFIWKERLVGELERRSSH